MRELRPFDHRTRNSFEFFALGGNGIHLGLVTSYCAEKTCFPMTLRLRGGERLHAVTDLTAGQRLDFTRSGDCFTIQLEFGHETSARLIAWEWGDFQTNG